jgi:hypothetical protein
VGDDNVIRKICLCGKKRQRESVYSGIIESGPIETRPLRKSFSIDYSKNKALSRHQSLKSARPKLVHDEHPLPTFSQYENPELDRDELFSTKRQRVGVNEERVVSVVGGEGDRGETYKQMVNNLFNQKHSFFKNYYSGAHRFSQTPAPKNSFFNPSIY